MAGISENKILLAIIAFFIAPLAVFLKAGVGLHFVINLILFLGAIGALAFADFAYAGLIAFIHALVVIFK